MNNIFIDKNRKSFIGGIKNLVLLKNHVMNSDIIVGDYTFQFSLDDSPGFEKEVIFNSGLINDKLIIGKFCMITSHVKFLLNAGNHKTNFITAYPFELFDKGISKANFEKYYNIKGDIIIENDVWIGYHSTIMSGVTIGNGAIIASNSVVVNDIPPYCIAGGNPAKVIKKRYSDDVIEKLLNIKWWDWEIDKIIDFIPLLRNDDMDSFLKAVENY